MAVVPVVGLAKGVEGCPDLHKLISEHRAAFDAFCLTIDDEAELPAGTKKHKAAEKACCAAGDAEQDTFEAVCSHRCRTMEEAKIKAEYLLTTATVKDTWDDEAKALLESFIA